MRTSLAVAALAMAVFLPAAGKKIKGVPLAKRPNQVAEIADVALTPAGQSCVNWAWAAVLESVLRQQQVDLAQTFWVRKMNGGDICLDRPLIVHESGRRAAPSDIQPQDLEALADAITGSYTLDSGRKFNLVARSSPGLPEEPNALIAEARAGRPILLFWRNRAYLLYSIVYDEYIYPTGQRMFITRELKLLDPLASAEKQKVSFMVGEDNPAEIEGVVQVTATPIEGTKWMR